MAIPVIQEPLDAPIRQFGLERCCFCRTKTDYWHQKNDVACCQPCAETHEESDLPTKEQWCRKEDRLNKQSSASRSRI